MSVTAADRAIDRHKSKVGEQRKWLRKIGEVAYRMDVDARSGIVDPDAMVRFQSLVMKYEEMLAR